jgi:Flavodoxin reductases (ferredoxin-NADPH reductases) family 1
MSDTFLNPVTTQTWANGRHIVRCVKVIQETWDVRTFCFMADQPIMFFFKPGQFVTLELEIEGKPVMRSYTISSSPSVPYSFSITVKRVPGGLVSNFLHDTMHEGAELPVHGPVGLFNAIDFPAARCCTCRWRGHYPGDVDGALVLRHQRQCRHGVRAQRSFAEGHHLPPRAGADGFAHTQLQPAHHLRKAWAG